ncbi:MAG TPA: DUF2459 domain-containing protein [Steroidobacteraceae bacterium]|nr:DUF2459 domain-containing protein [Steroidobacteraceae bacterium]
MRTAPLAALLTALAWLAQAGAPAPARAAAAGEGAAPANVAATEDGAATEDRAAAGGEVSVYLVRRKWHIEVGFATRDSGAALAAVAARFPHSRYLFFGFGDRHYLLARHHGSSSLLAALWPGPGLILVTAIENSPAQAFGASQVLAFELAPRRARQLRLFIARSLAPPAAQAAELEPEAPGPYEGSLYYGALPRYSALHTCNTWAAEALRAAGLPVRTRLVIFAGQLWGSARKLVVAPPGTDRARGGAAPALNRRAADYRSRTPPWWSSLAVPPRWSFAAAPGSSC